MATFRLPRPTATRRRPAARSICLTAVLVALLVAAMPAGADVGGARPRRADVGGARQGRETPLTPPAQQFVDRPARQ
jgi:hypothetical protein